jgi:hypothetical protein
MAKLLTCSACSTLYDPKPAADVTIPDEADCAACSAGPRGAPPVGTNQARRLLEEAAELLDLSSPRRAELLAAAWSGIAYREPPSVLSSKNAASTVEGQRQMSLPPCGPVRKPWTAPGGIKTNVPGPTSSTESASV